MSFFRSTLPGAEGEPPDLKNTKLPPKKGQSETDFPSPRYLRDVASSFSHSHLY